MVDIRLLSNGNVRLRWYLSNGFANANWPTVAELNAGLDLADGVLWENYDFGVQASDTSSVTPISAKAELTRRGQTNYGGSLSIWYPGYYGVASNQLSLIYDAVSVPRTNGYIVTSIDGSIGDVGQPTRNFANGDLLSVFRVWTDSWEDMTEGDDDFYYTIDFKRGGLLAHYTVASTAAPVVALGAAPVITGVGTKAKLSATVNGRVYTGGVVWSSSAPTIISVSSSGIATRVGAGTATITATVPKTTAPVTGTVVIAA